MPRLFPRPSHEGFGVGLGQALDDEGGFGGSDRQHVGDVVRPGAADAATGASTRSRPEIARDMYRAPTCPVGIFTGEPDCRIISE